MTRIRITQIPAMIAEQAADLSGVADAWVSPEGKVYVVPTWGHNEWAVRHLRGDERGEEALERMGWFKISEGELYNEAEVTQPQFDTIFDWYLANGFEDDFKPAMYRIR